MKLCSKCGEVKPLPSFNRDARNLDGRTSQCSACQRNRARSYYANNRGVLLQRQLQRQATRRNEKAAYDRERYLKLADHERARSARRRVKKSPLSEQERADRAQVSALRLAARRRAAASQRRALVRQRTVPWANPAAIKAVYERAVDLSARTGVLWQVDHVVPLKHRLVCGLHCEFNLEPLPSVINRAKSNRYWPDMPE